MRQRRRYPKIVWWNAAGRAGRPPAIRSHSRTRWWQCSSLASTESFGPSCTNGRRGSRSTAMRRPTSSRCWSSRRGKVLVRLCLEGSSGRRCRGCRTLLQRPFDRYPMGKVCTTTSWVRVPCDQVGRGQVLKSPSDTTSLQGTPRTRRGSTCREESGCHGCRLGTAAAPTRLACTNTRVRKCCSSGCQIWMCTCR